MKSLYAHLSLLAQAYPERTALIICNTEGNIVEEISRARVLQKIVDIASRLQSRGLRAGDRIALELENSAELLLVSWAAWSVGIVTVPLDVRRDTPETHAFKMRVSGATHVWKKEEFTAATEKARWVPDLSHDALILFTSGTTARPKGALLTLQNLIVNAEGIIEWLRVQENDRFLVELPLYHINSTTFCLASLIAGASIALPPAYSNSRFFAHAALSGATFTSVVPSIIFDQLTRIPEFETVRHRLKLNRIQLGSAPVIARDALEFMQKFSIPLYQGYGQTETALRVTGVPLDLPRDIYMGLTADNTIGIPMSWAQVEVADAQGHILGEEEMGELMVKGPAVMKGYIGNEPAFRNGYFLTGDIGYYKTVEGRRFLFIKSR
jgi:long-chain acyl-CoA synthetase